MAAASGAAARLDMKIGVLGSGVVAQTLGAGFLKHGHEVALGTRDPAKLAQWGAANPRARIVSFSEAAAFAEVVALAVGGEVALDALKLAGDKTLDGKIVIDACNPIGGGPPVNGVLRYFTSLTDSLMERLQAAYPKARFVKAFNSVGAAQMVNPQFSGGRPTMFICGADAAAKQVVAKLLDQFGWDTEDMGAVEAARAIEPLCMLWCIPGVGRGDWSPHAFKLLR
jgi:8-hydroxy-5-deazaflavin:NADPH oxidoreductase